jgi:DMSO/TMAO reductase YedYZ heme-binding membrane subunit
MSSTVLWYATRATGLMAMVLLSATTVLGILTANRVSARWWPGFAQQELHRRVSMIAMVFLGGHIATSILDSYVHIGWAAVVVPFASPYKRLWVTVGTIAFDLLLAIAVTSVLRHRIPPRLWRAVHWLAYLSWPVALAHGFGMGTDMHLGWVVDLSIGCIAAVVGAGAWRVALSGARRRLALAGVPVRNRPDGVPVKHLPV